MRAVREPWSIDAARDRALTAGADAAIDAFLDRLATRPHPNVWISLVPEPELRARAAELDAHAATRRRLALHGVPFAVKDNIDVAGMATTAAARASAYLATSDAPVVKRLLDAGAICVGKTNLDRFAAGLSGTQSPEFGVCANPFDARYIAGGSSSGSAVAVALGVVPIALGTDTAGSGRIPAACCGVIGVKPTHERVSTDGVVPATPWLDTIAIFASSARDASLVSDAGGEPDRDLRCRPAPTPWRIGVPRGLAWFADRDSRRCYDAAVARLAAGGAELHEIDLSPFLEAGALLYGSVIVGPRPTAFGGFALEHGTSPRPAAPVDDAPTVFRSLQELAHLHSATAGIWNHVDALVVPTIARHPTIAAALRNPRAVDRDLGTYTNFVNLLDFAAVAVPAGTRASGLPFGVTLIGPAFSDRALLALAARFLDAAPPGPHPAPYASVSISASGSERSIEPATTTGATAVGD